MTTNRTSIVRSGAVDEKHRREQVRTPPALRRHSSHGAESFTEAERRLDAENLAIHPHFSDQGDMILVSSDYVGFKIAFAELRRCSRYFSGWEIVSLDEDRLPMFRLIDAAADPLALVLGTHSSKLRRLFAEPEDVIPLIPDALAIASKYEFTDFYSLLFRAFAQADIFVRFALAALADDEVSARELSARTLDHRMKLSSGVEQMLRRCAPSYLKRLSDLHHTRNGAYDALELSLATDLAGVNIKLEGYGLACKKRFGRGCEAFIKTDGKFAQLRKIVAHATVEALKSTKAAYLTAEVEDAIHDAAECQTCANRHINAFGACLRRADLHLLPRTI